MTSPTPNDERSPRAHRASLVVDTWCERLEEALSDTGARRTSHRSELPDWITWLGACGFARRTNPDRLDAHFRLQLQAACERLDRSGAQDRGHWRSVMSESTDSLFAAWKSEMADRQPRRTEQRIAMLERTDTLALASVELTNRDADWDRPSFDATASSTHARVFAERWRVYALTDWVAMRAEDLGRARTWFKHVQWSIEPSRATLARKPRWQHSNADFALSCATMWIQRGSARVLAAHREKLAMRDAPSDLANMLRLVGCEVATEVAPQIARLPLADAVGVIGDRWDWSRAQHDVGATMLSVFMHHAHAPRAAARDDAPLAHSRLEWTAVASDGTASCTIQHSAHTANLVIRFYDREGKLNLNLDGARVDWLGSSSTITGGSANFSISALSQSTRLGELATAAATLTVDEEPWLLMSMDDDAQR